MINYNNFCQNCEKSTVCTWYEKISKLEGTERKPSIVDITIDSCEEFLEVEDNNIDDDDDPDDE